MGVAYLFSLLALGLLLFLDAIAVGDDLTDLAECELRRSRIKLSCRGLELDHSLEMSAIAILCDCLFVREQLGLKRIQKGRGSLRMERTPASIYTCKAC